MRMHLILILISVILGSCKNEPDYHFNQVNGKQLHVLTWGKGEPVVVFLNGGGSALEDFSIVQEKIAKITKTISYDKPGIGKSQLANSPRTLENVSDELKELLAKEWIGNTPIIFVGHSMGGYVARYYLNRYPDNIVGLVLVDPGSEYLEEEYRKISTDEENRIADSTLAAQIKLIPKGFQMEAKAYPSHDSILKTFSIETDIPIILLESNKIENASDKILIDLQKKLYRDFKKKVPQTKIISTSQSGHFIQLDEPELVIGAIKEMLSQAN
jgi:pimeloyl-ACP methyl ester carboxylesterase